MRWLEKRPTRSSYRPAEQRTAVGRVEVEDLEDRGRVVLEGPDDKRVEGHQILGVRTQDFHQVRPVQDVGRQPRQRVLTRRERGLQAVELGVVQADVARVGPELIARRLFPAVDDVGHGPDPVGGYPGEPGEDALQQDPVAGPQHVNVAGRAERGHHVVHHAEDLDVGVRAVRAEDVHVDLPVLADPPALRPFVPVAVGVAVPANRELQGARVPGDHAGHRGRHLRPQRQAAPPAVGERVQLQLGDFLSGLGLVDLRGLQDGAVVAEVPVAFRDVVEPMEHLLPHRHLRREEIPCPAVRGGRQKAAHGQSLGLGRGGEPDDSSV